MIELNYQINGNMKIKKHEIIIVIGKYVDISHISYIIV